MSKVAFKVYPQRATPRPEPMIRPVRVIEAGNAALAVGRGNRSFMRLRIVCRLEVLLCPQFAFASTLSS